MADDSKYGKNRNLWRKVYGFRRRKPVQKTLVDANTGVTFSYDLQTTLRHRDFFIIQTNATASAIQIIPPEPPTSSLGEYDEGLISFANSDTETANFTSCFSAAPDAVVLTIEPTGNDDENIIPYGISFNECSMSVGLSAPFNGNVRYRAVYSSTGYPVEVTSAYEPGSGSFYVSAGHLTASLATDYTASFDKNAGSLSFFAKTPWDFFNNNDVDVFISEDGETINPTNGSVSGSISAPLSNPIYFIAFF